MTVKQLIDRDVFVLPWEMFCPNASMNIKHNEYFKMPLYLWHAMGKYILQAFT